jgi:hypothetical protein
MEDVEDPHPHEGQVRIRVAAAGVHVLGTVIRRGLPSGPLPLPRLLMTPGRKTVLHPRQVATYGRTPPGGTRPRPRPRHRSFPVAAGSYLWRLAPHGPAATPDRSSPPCPFQLWTVRSGRVRASSATPRKPAGLRRKTGGNVGQPPITCRSAGSHLRTKSVEMPMRPAPRSAIVIDYACHMVLAEGRARHWGRVCRRHRRPRGHRSCSGSLRRDLGGDFPTRSSSLNSGARLVETSGATRFTGAEESP